jgi:PIN domain nuclease of toxin-antitoxin system
MILLDTHVLYWAAAEPRRLSRRAARAIEKAAPSGDVFISSVTLYELAGMVRRGQVRATGSPQDTVETIVEAVRAGVHEITAEVAVLAQYLPDDFPHDPMDRLIAATAQAWGISLVTRDERMIDSPQIDTIW